MRRALWLLWLLCALLLVAAADPLPDPPATVSRGIAARSFTGGSHHDSAHTVQRIALPLFSTSLQMPLAMQLNFLASLPVCLVDLAHQGSDPSPPYARL
ncbi:MAG TPA: hypothetical protein VK604_26780 [Bryobacteraceae bacterium]|nr:hypothetical protein [Bryobacteraceae bacterium]